ncbi:hypothetical protein PHYBLDRAFT_174904 [Phycomyces blakesleeanus NRRL 1555(-)]|uniref:Uncharacterized protein n=1 Tax=Phycomyces blakesleeanus (strain ATCC 8743b / DSM 1359 / FGSC 10004 / NBRC 33097 / NRRL 1555) TaxID=763407 RepID=A0A167JXP8_PHYB8|nr:hypothetical protein PHYBLDRAFT_174904 [Phycomyces blakesleeanus NRRL 1555(-)]OAD66886.1 hypothetical protein PHYBLDRAFT_174904 [Phycomyces blakesleeanus NRRL 1555(-)]|eukprot:XP_018284926.1 hypothetical protein PHYBLDRAFT_174904 [Phycomyces blakesleeanus NRRL 1555(-)]
MKTELSVDGSYFVDLVWLLYMSIFRENSIRKLLRVLSRKERHRVRGISNINCMKSASHAGNTMTRVYVWSILGVFKRRCVSDSISVKGRVLVLIKAGVGSGSTLVAQW